MKLELPRSRTGRRRAPPASPLAQVTDPDEIKGNPAGQPSLYAVLGIPENPPREVRRESARGGEQYLELVGAAALVAWLYSCEWTLFFSFDAQLPGL